MRSLVLLALLPIVALAQAAEHAGHEGHTAQSEQPGAMPPGYAEVTVAAERTQLIGLTTAKAERAQLSGNVRASAILQPDETREAHVHSKLMGWVQELYANAVGQQVKKGDPLYSLYSQELFAAQQEYVRARVAAPDLAQAARQRLLLWDVPEDQLRLIERSGPRKAIVFRSPIAGTILEKSVLQGHYVEPGEMLYRVADISRVWVLASVYEYEVPRIQVGATATVEVQGLPDKLEARVDYVYPTIDPVSRAARVRIIADNQDGSLRPGNFATVELPTKPIEAIWVPETAIIDTGVRQVVYVALGGGRFRPVVVHAGRRAQGRAEIIHGLAAGTDVVTGAQFLIDSESRLRGSAQPGGHSGHGGH